MQNKKNNKDLKKQAVIIMLNVILFCFSTRLFSNYINASFSSDFPSHINTVLDGKAKYSLMHRLIGLCYFTPPHSNFALAALMGGLILGTSIGMWLYISKRINNINNKVFIFIIAISLLFTSNIYIPIYFPSLYNHYTKVSQPWHNSTYILMRFWAALVIYTYFEVYNRLKKNLFKIQDGIWFCLFLTLCNFSKPNFFLAFTPMVFFTLVYLLWKEKGKNFRQLFSFGCLILFSMPILFYQIQIVYDESEKSSIALSLECFRDYVFGIPGKFFVYEISNLCFPIFVVIVLLILKYVKHQNIEFDRLVQGGLMFIIAHLQQLLMIDEGPRADSGNYAWGVYAVGMLLFMICISEWITVYKKNLLKNKCIFIIGLSIYFLHISCGIVYFIKLCQGYKYII